MKLPARLLVLSLVATAFLSFARKGKIICRYIDKQETVALKSNITFFVEDAALHINDTDTIPVKGQTYEQRNGHPPRVEDMVFTKAEFPPAFPGGNEAWAKYITKYITKNIEALTIDREEGTCRVRFIVDTSGNVRDIEALTMKGTVLSKIAVNAIKFGPIWIPAKQNGRIVNAFKIQPITFTMRNNKNNS